MADYIERALEGREPRTRRERAVAEAKKAAEKRALERKGAVQKAEKAYV
jgi:hypothetical protein